MEPQKEENTKALIKCNYSKKHRTQKMKFPIKDLISKCDQIRVFPADSVIFTEEIVNEKCYFFVQ